MLEILGNVIVVVAMIETKLIVALHKSGILLVRKKGRMDTQLLTLPSPEVFSHNPCSEHFNPASVWITWIINWI